MRKQIFFLFIPFFVLITKVTAQQDVLYAPDILPKAPESAAFEKNVNIPVSYSSGTPQINIPFATVKSGSLEVPVSLSYNASGIRVEETATWVGLGWSLNAGGQISRTVRGKPDEEGTYGYMVTPGNRRAKYVDTAHCRCPESTGQTWAIESDIATYGIDLEPDLFTFSVLGYSGDFVYNQDSAKFILIPYQNILIEGFPEYFVLTLPDGVKCYFGNKPHSKEVLTNGQTISYIDGYIQAPAEISPQENAWLLTEIVDPANKSVEFTYTAETVTVFGRGGERFGRTITESEQILRRQTFFKQYIQQPVLQKISGESGNVYFKQSSSEREDIPADLGSLDTIVVTNASNEELKSFYLNYDYFISSDNLYYGVLDLSAFINEAKRRLRLKSITQKNGNDSLPPYEFTYNDIELPNRFSTSQDYWGYYNGKTNSTSLMPQIPTLPFYPWFLNYNEVTQNLPSYGVYLNTGGANRRIDTNYSQAGMLTKIKYPTGGTTKYFYEQNEVSTADLNIYGGMEPPDMVDRYYSLNLTTNPIPADPPYPLYFTGTFTINIPVTKVKIIPVLPTCTTYVDASCKLLVKLKKLPDSTLYYTINTTLPFDLQLGRGQYLVEVFVDGLPADYPPSFNIGFQWGERTDSLDFLAGGIRIKKIISTDSTGNSISRSFTYHYDLTNQGSGVLEGIPVYKVHDVNSEGIVFRQYYVSNSVIPLTDGGKTARYQFVTEYYDTLRSSFKTNYAFTSGLSDPVKHLAGAQTGAPLLSWSWQSGLLKSKEVFEKTAAGVYRPLSIEQNYYYPHQPISDRYGLYGPQIIPYDIATEWYLPDSSVTTTYSYAGGTVDSIQTTSKTLYNNRYLPSLTRSVNSKGEKLYSKTWYPVDYNDVSGYNIPALYDKHIWSLPIKQESSVNGKIRSGSIIKYNEYGQLLDGYSYENAVLTDTTAHDPNTVLESNYHLKTSIRYDAMGNISQVNNNKSGPVAYIWDYGINQIDDEYINKLPVAMVQNADSNAIAYASFEAAGNGNWTYSELEEAADATSPMGKKCFYVSGTNISKSGLSSSVTYIVSYWSKNGSYSVSGSVSSFQGKTINGWTYYEHRVTGVTTVSISGTGYIDELRLYPKGALMTTYAYKYGVGLTSQCDPSGRIVYYEYDDLQRLSLIRDEDRTILKKICYNYAGQPENCYVVYQNAVQSGNFTRNNCDTGYTGGTVTYTVAAGTYSSTVSQADANQQALDDVTANGQAYANANGTCTVTCTTGNCTGQDKKCVYGVCETGIKVYTSSHYNVITNQTTCVYHYEWSDGSWSFNYNEYHTGDGPFCPVMD